MLSQAAKARLLAGRFGGWVNGELSPGEVPLSRLVAEFGTPLYLYHAGMLTERLQRVRGALGDRFEVLYSLKANPALGVCQVLAGAGAGAEVASAGELVLAQAADFAPADIVFAGPGKTDDELLRAVEAGIWAVNVESLGEIKRLARVAQRGGRTIGVGLRINPAQALIGSQMRMGGLATQFGIDEADVPEAIQTTLAEPSLELRGIHVYNGTQIFDADALLEQCRAVLDLARTVSSLADRALQMIDFGGGFGVPYFDKSPELDLERFGTSMQDLVDTYSSEPWLRGCRMSFELGRYLTAEAGLYVTRVVDVKHSRGMTFVVGDGGMHHHLAATGNFGQVFRKAYPILNLTRPEADSSDPVTLAGPCCTPLDVFGSHVPLGPVEVGDLIGVFYSGAYGFTASNLMFLSHATPAEVLVGGGRAHLLRAPGRPEDVLTGQAGLGGQRPIAQS